MTHKNGRNFLTCDGALSSAHTASPRSGRNSLAQRETLGTRSELDPSAVGTAAVLNRRQNRGSRARPTFKAVAPTGLRILQRPVPSVSRWARLWRPLRGLAACAEAGPQRRIVENLVRRRQSITILARLPSVARSARLLRPGRGIGVRNRHLESRFMEPDPQKTEKDILKLLPPPKRAPKLTSRRIGIHTSTAGGVELAAERAYRLGCKHSRFSLPARGSGSRTSWRARNATR